MSTEYISSNLLVHSPLFSAGVKAGNFLYTSGQIALDASTEKLKNSSFEEEVNQCLNNIKVVLDVAGLDFKDIIKMTIFLTDISLYNTFNEIYKNYFPNQKPTRSLVEVSKLALGAKIEIEAIAYKKE